MRDILGVALPYLVAAWLSALPLQRVSAAETPCGPFQGVPLHGGFLDGPLADVIRHHAEWLRKYPQADRSSFEADTDPLRAHLCGAVLTNASFFVEDMSGADFSHAILEGVDFRGTTLVDANFSDAKLVGANFLGADLSGALFGGADVKGVVFEPKPGRLPHEVALRRLHRLERLTFATSPDGLLSVREMFRKAGRRDLERAVTFAVEHTRTVQAGREGHWLEAAFRYGAWEFPTDYDLSPGRALFLVLAGIALFAVAYWRALAPGGTNLIWRVLPADRIGGEGKVSQQPANAVGLSRVIAAVQFSAISAFQLGWRELSVGSWLQRLQRQEYSFKAVGWVRSLSGVQSLISLYLLAMWALTYFGRLFEG